MVGVAAMSGINPDSDVLARARLRRRHRPGPRRALRLTAAAWTRELETTLPVADRLDTGYVWIKGSSRHFLGAPYSGYKNSGTDSEEGIEELFSCTQNKTVNVSLT
jgi:acyl-CoA reductase-like NAD-dependent aldehyde dehydrogenase